MKEFINYIKRIIGMEYYNTKDVSDITEKISFIFSGILDNNVPNNVVITDSTATKLSYTLSLRNLKTIDVYIEYTYNSVEIGFSNTSITNFDEMILLSTKISLMFSMYDRDIATLFIGIINRK